MKTIVLKTKRVASHNEAGESIYEENKLTLSPEQTFNKWLKHLPNLGFAKVEVVQVLDGSKEVDEIDIYNEKVKKALKPEIKLGDAVDYKALSEKQSKLLEEMEARLSQLEQKGKPGRKSKEEIED